MRQCGDCDKTFQDDSLFCPYCGKELTVVQEDASSCDGDTSSEAYEETVGGAEGEEATEADARESETGQRTGSVQEAVVAGMEESEAREAKRRLGRPGFMVKHGGLMLALATTLVFVCALFYLLEIDYYFNIKPDPSYSEAQILESYANDPDLQLIVERRAAQLSGVAAAAIVTTIVLILSISAIIAVAVKRFLYTRKVKRFTSDHPGIRVEMPNYGWFFLFTSIFVSLCGLALAAGIAVLISYSAANGTLYEAGFVSSADRAIDSLDVFYLINSNYVFKVGLCGMLLGTVLGLIQLIYAGFSNSEYLKASQRAFVVELIAGPLVYMLFPHLVDLPKLLLGFAVVAAMLLWALIGAGRREKVFDIVSNGQKVGEMERRDEGVVIRMYDE